MRKAKMGKFLSCFGSCFDPELKKIEQCMFETHHV